jgi:hypothetical protein
MCILLDFLKVFIVIFSDLSHADINSSAAPTNKLSSGVTFYTGPYLDGSGVSNVTTQIGTHAYLPCRVSRKKTIFIKFNTQTLPNPIKFNQSAIHQRQ